MRHPGKVSAPSKYLTTEIGLVLTGHLGEDTIVMPDKPAPRSLMTRARNGDTRARGVVLERCAPIIWSFCRWYGPSRLDTDDIGPSARPRLAALIDALRELAVPPDRLADTTNHECGKVLRAAANVPSANAHPTRDRARRPACTGRSWLFIAERDALLREALTIQSPRCRQLAADPPVPGADIRTTPAITVGSIRPYRRGCLNAVRRGPPLAAAVSGETRDTMRS